MKQILVSIICVLSVLLAHAQPTEIPGKTIDKIIGGVGAEIVLLSELENAKYELTQGRTPVSQQKECSMFENLMYQKLLLHQAKLDSVEVTEGEIANQV
jgi:peptidyl-prolyl cis-trans isomerase SurA